MLHASGGRLLQGKPRTTRPSPTNTYQFGDLPPLTVCLLTEAGVLAAASSSRHPPSQLHQRGLKQQGSLPGGQRRARLDVRYASVILGT